MLYFTGFDAISQNYSISPKGNKTFFSLGIQKPLFNILLPNCLKNKQLSSSYALFLLEKFVAIKVAISEKIPWGEMKIYGKYNCKTAQLIWVCWLRGVEMLLIRQVMENYYHYVYIKLKFETEMFA